MLEECYQRERTDRRTRRHQGSAQEERGHHPQGEIATSRRTGIKEDAEEVEMMTQEEVEEEERVTTEGKEAKHGKGSTPKP